MNEHRQDNTHAQDHKHRYAHTLSASSSSTCIYNHITITTDSPFYFRKSNVKSKIMKMITRTLAANSSPCLCCLHHHRNHHRPHHMISQTQEEKQQQQQEEQQQSHGQRQQRYFSLSSLSSSPLLCFALISYLLLSLLSSSTTTAAQSNVGAISVPLPPPHAAALAAPGGVGSSILDQFSPNCSAVSHVFQARGIDLGEVPQKPSNEMVLRYCESPTVGTCCTYNMETKMAMQSRLQLEKHSKEQILKLSSTFASKANKFNDVFRKLLLESKEEFHNMFTRTYGIIYQQNSYVFSDLFNELESYYARGRVDLIEVMDKFFNVLYQKMFQVLNSQYLFDEKYLRCVSEHMKELKPFGDVPDKLSVQIKRSFVATRTFAHALLTAAEVSKKLVNVRLNADCTAALTKMQHCGACKGYAEKPCTNYCVNVIKGCLHYFSDFDVEWENFASAMDKVAERLLGSFNIVMVVEPINIKISEAIMNFQDSGQDITSRVFQGCGRPALGRVNQNPKFAAIAQQPQEQHQQFIAGSSSSNGGNGGSIDSGSSSGNADSRLVMRRAALEESAAEQIESDILDIDAALDDAIVLREKRVPEPQTEHGVASVSDEPSTAPRSGGGVNAGGNGGGGGSGENGGRAGGGGRRNQKRKQKKGDDSEHVAYDPVLDKMVRDIRQRVKDSKKFWSNLPHQICSNDEISASSDIDGMCWNGHTIDRYMHSVTTEHGRNPEFPGNPATTRQTSQVATQLYYLKNVISHLRNAYNGQDVDWSEQEEPYYGSGSGSGGGNDDEDDDEGSGLGSPFTPSRKPDHTDHPAVHVNQNVDDEDDEDAVDERHDGAGRAGTGTDAHTTRPKYTGESGGDTNGLDEDLDLGAGGQSNEIDGDDEKSNGNGSASTKPQKMSLRRALLVYLLPLFMAWFGGIFADLL